MKTWLSLYRLSLALDQRSPGKEPTPARAGSCPAAEELRAVDALLRAHSATAGAAPVYFHGSILRAVRASAGVPRARAAAWPRWAPALGLTMVALAGLLWLRVQTTPSGSTPEPLESASSALVMGNKIAQTAPSTLAKPMTDELERVNRDIERTTAFLFSSLP